MFCAICFYISVIGVGKARDHYVVADQYALFSSIPFSLYIH